MFRAEDCEWNFFFLFFPLHFPDPPKQTKAHLNSPFAGRGFIHIESPHFIFSSQTNHFLPPPSIPLSPPLSIPCPFPPPFPSYPLFARLQSKHLTPYTPISPYAPDPENRKNPKMYLTPQTRKTTLLQSPTHNPRTRFFFIPTILSPRSRCAHHEKRYKTQGEKTRVSQPHFRELEKHSFHRNPPPPPEHEPLPPLTHEDPHFPGKTLNRPLIPSHITQFPLTNPPRKSGEQPLLRAHVPPLHFLLFPCRDFRKWKIW